MDSEVPEPTSPNEFSRYDSELKNEMERIFLPGMNIEHRIEGRCTPEEATIMKLEDKVFIDEVLWASGRVSSKTLLLARAAQIVDESAINRHVNGFDKLTRGRTEHHETVTEIHRKQGGGGFLSRFRKKEEQQPQATSR